MEYFLFLFLDPMSPHASDFGGDVMSPITSPPATPLQVQETEHQQQNLDSHRRRAMSVLRIGKDDVGTSYNEDENEVKFVLLLKKLIHYVCHVIRYDIYTNVSI